MSINSLRVVDTSLKCGVLLRITGESARIEANSIGKAEFLLPAIFIDPLNGFSPLIVNLYIIFY